MLFVINDINECLSISLKLVPSETKTENVTVTSKEKISIL